MKRSVKIRQQDKYDCGAACLGSVAAWYGLQVPLIRVRKQCGCTRDGISVRGLLEGARELGLDGRAFKSPDKNPAPLMQIRTPVIVHLKKEDGYYHFAVLYKTAEHCITLMDPAFGEFTRITPEQFAGEWTGYLILLLPGKEFKRGDGNKSFLFRIRFLLQFHKRELILSGTGSIVLVFMGIANSLFLQQIIDRAVPLRDAGLLFTILAFSGISMLLSLAVGYIRSLLLLNTGLQIDARLILGYIRKIFSLRPEELSSFSAGDLNSRLNDAWQIRTFITEGILSLFISIITIIAAFGLLFTQHRHMALLLLLFIPLYALLGIYSGRLHKTYNRRIAQSDARFETRLIDSLESLGTIRHFGTEALVLEKVEESYSDLADGMYRAGKTAAGFISAAEAVGRLITVSILAAGGWWVFREEMTVGELVSFYTVSTFFITPINRLTEMNQAITQALVSSERLFELFDLAGDPAPPDEFPAGTHSGSRAASTENGPIRAPGEYERLFSRRLSTHPARIRIDGLSFRYPGCNPLLDRLTFDLEPGKITALSGPSGCGKSTLASLLLQDRFPDSGSIRLYTGGIWTDIKRFSSREWLRYAAIVPQRIDLFDATLLENIVSGDPEPDFDRIFRILKRIGLERLIDRLPKGLFSDIEDRGNRLSGGERQKIAIARVLYRNPRLIIFDEATSSQDHAAEENILSLIKQLRQEGKTIVLITHARKHLALADTVVTLSSAPEPKPPEENSSEIEY